MYNITSQAWNSTLHKGKWLHWSQDYSKLCGCFWVMFWSGLGNVSAAARSCVCRLSSRAADSSWPQLGRDSWQLLQIVTAGPRHAHRTNTILHTSGAIIVRYIRDSGYQDVQSIQGCCPGFVVKKYKIKEVYFRFKKYIFVPKEA